KIAEKIITKGGDYVFDLKGNQGILHKEVVAFFAQSDKQHNGSLDFFEEDKSHGRITVRRCYTSDALDSISLAGKWEGFSTIAKVECESERDGKATHEHRYYYIGSIPNDAEAFAKAIRTHSGIENELHWVLDVAFR
ncbi:MAG TPA: ISAs1 family transposase, partial [Desulfocapsa sulfexigens]|nr:ISAs1 family transposase [Desulfocapsa sulfexigens]